MSAFINPAAALLLADQPAGKRQGKRRVLDHLFHRIPPRRIRASSPYGQG
jgi:hypothetical protein